MSEDLSPQGNRSNRPGEPKIPNQNWLIWPALILLGLALVFQDPFGHLQFDMESHPIGTARIWLVGTPYDLQCLLRVELNHTATNLIG